MTEQAYKNKIEEAVKQSPQRFHAPNAGAREVLLQNRCKADFCFNIIPNGRLFIEDDDAARGVSNLIKYWIWAEANPGQRPIHVVHIIETSRPAAVEAVAFLGQKMQASIPGFEHHIITLASWQDSDDVWLPKLQQCLSRIAG